MTMSETKSATSSVKIQVLVDSSAAKRKSWMNYGESKIATTDDKIWLNDTGSLGALTQKFNFTAKTRERHASILSNMTPLVVSLLRCSIGADSSTFLGRVAEYAKIADQLYPVPSDDPHIRVGERDEERSDWRFGPTTSALGDTGGSMFPSDADSSTASPAATDFSAFARDFFPDLCDALHDLREARTEAREEGFPVPSRSAVENGRRLLHCMYGALARRFEVYPTPDGEIAIDVPCGSDRSILLLCDSDGGALYFVHIDGVQICAQYSDASSIPDEFLPVALAAMKRID